LVNFAGNETFERLAVFGLFANFMVYLTRELHLDQVTASNILSLWFGITNFAPLVGAFISDAYVGRFRTIAFASFGTLSVSSLILYNFSFSAKFNTTYSFSHPRLFCGLPYKRKLCMCHSINQ